MDQNTSSLNFYRSDDYSRFFLPINQPTVTSTTYQCSTLHLPIPISMYDGASDLARESSSSTYASVPETTAMMQTTTPLGMTASVQASTTRAAQLRKKIEETQKQLSEIDEQIAGLVTQYESLGSEEPLPLSLRRTEGKVGERRRDSSSNGDYNPSENSTETHNTRDSCVSEDEVAEGCKTYLKVHTALLTKYNNMKDAALSMLGMIAEREGRTLKSVMEEREIEDD